MPCGLRGILSTAEGLEGVILRTSQSPSLKICELLRDRELILAGLRVQQARERPEEERVEREAVAPRLPPEGRGAAW